MPSWMPVAHPISRSRRMPTPKRGGMKADPLWTQMYHHFTLRQADFNRHYHLRSDVETCLHMIKAKLGEKLRAKSDTAMVNEVLMRVLCHNLCVLIRAMYTMGITPVFGAERNVT